MNFKQNIKFVRRQITDKLFYTYSDQTTKNKLEQWYFKKTGEKLNLDNPRTFNEKIQWLKLYDNTELKTLLADKYRVRKWVAERIGEEHLVPILGVWDNFSQINFNLLPNQFVLKTNHSSGWNSIIKDKSLMSYKEEKQKFNIWMKQDFTTQYGYELHYMNIPRKIIAEEYLSELDGAIIDYRFFCFSGKVKFVWVDNESGTEAHRRTIFDDKWEKQNYSVDYSEILPTPGKPDTFDEMKGYAEVISKDFAFARVDFYSINNHVWFGEVTFTPQSGVGKWSDESQNLIYGTLIELPNKQSIPRKF